MRVRLRPEAHEDLRDAAEWYETKRPGLGSEFLDEMLRTISAASNAPGLYARVYGEIRRAPTHRFPFGVFYVVDEEDLVILAVMHGSRDPSRWKRRT